GGGIHRGGGASGAHDREIGQDPLVARRGRDADPLLALEPEGEQAGREASYPIARLAPADGLPAVAHWEPEGLVVTAALHAVEELYGAVLRHRVEETRVVVDGHDAPCMLVRDRR